MSYMHKLMHIEYYLKSLSLFKKILLITVPLLFLVMIYFFIEPTDGSFYYSKMLDLKTKLNTLKQQKESKVDILKIIQDLEFFASNHNIKIHMIKQNKNSLNITFQCDSKVLINFIEFCEWFHPFSKVQFLNIHKDIEQISGQVKISFQHYYQKNRGNFDTKKDVIPEKKLILNAIVGDYVVINNQVYGESDLVDSYVIKKIDQNSVLLKNSENSKRLEVYKDVKK